MAGLCFMHPHDAYPPKPSSQRIGGACGGKGETICLENINARFIKLHF
ncbi:hypothetical protein SAMN05216386_1596 [Nitrosospira briensis]|uniref:Uncharacterized protein n=1 Tax=Nitrosospira briensis TaxID=35799 RepID=A0A1I5AZF2_9PROT|nr:hypothetical protein SAMN05216386_1596 [Nitrosospira briensis]